MSANEIKNSFIFPFVIQKDKTATEPVLVLDSVEAPHRYYLQESGNFWDSPPINRQIHDGVGCVNCPAAKKYGNRLILESATPLGKKYLAAGNTDDFIRTVRFSCSPKHRYLLQATRDNMFIENDTFPCERKKNISIGRNM